MLKKNVLRKKSDFTAIYNKGKSVGDKYIVLFYKKNNLPYNRKAFLASKKVGNSVKRNRARRLMKESFRLTEFKIPQGYDFIFIARNTIVNAKCAEVKKSLESALRRTGVNKK
ncbi:MAG: ribonuclease P protein component [Lachnospiraceae bacterium]|nr:ribonuclease P protein component [Lachnospiraceae bacterium]